MKRLLVVPLLAALALATAQPGQTFQNGAPSLDCMACHTSPGEQTATLEIKGVPKNFEPGVTYELRVSVLSDIRSLGDVKGGFVVQASAGQLIVVDELHTQLSGGMLTHTIEGANKRSWRLAWQAPSSAAEIDIMIMAAAVNGDYAPMGDAVTVEMVSLAPAR